jgi:acyl transferase domain-containing protein
MRSDQIQAAVMIGKPSQAQKYLHKVYYGRNQAKLPAATKNGFSSESAIVYESYPADCLPNSVRLENTAIPISAEKVTDSASASESVSLSELRNYLKTSLAARLGLKPTVVDGDQPFGEVGLDSFLGAEWVAAINEKYGTALPNIVIYDYPCVNAMAHLLESELKKRRTSSTTKTADAIRSDSSGSPLRSKAPNRNTSAWVGRTKKNDARRHDAHTADKVAIIGMSGRYPQADNLGEYWDNLVHGRNSIVEVPRSRWDVDQYYDPNPENKGKTYSKWLGLMDDIDCFDPLFFRISPSEAVYMDPQQRLFLQESYRAFEDSGYSAADLDKKKCGVYLGVSTSEYGWLLSKNNALSNNATGNSDAIAAARIAYHLNLRGPAIAVDTACSSSLVAIHLACQGLLNHETDMALAGGINLWFLPESFQGMSQAGMVSPDGQCKAFDDGANGIVVGDGVGAVVLKRLRDAEADNDHIYAVILGSAINQDGRTNGITAPSVNSQIELLRDVYTRHKINPETISYIETHGTGTKLGDPIELTALDTVFKEKSARRNYCALASVKTNIGHTGAAAGIASVHKVLLSLRNRTLVPSLNVTVENSRFDFKDSPFYINRHRQAWSAGSEGLRRSGVSAFGYSGTNAHLVIEEYPAATESGANGTASGDSDFIVPLSARTRGQLLQKARDLLEFLRGPGYDSESTEQRMGSRKAIDLSAVAYTLQVGREAMEERLGCVVKSVDQLLERLSAYVDGGNNMQGVYQGRVESDAGGMATIGQDGDMREVIDKWIARRNVSRLLELWVRGLNVDWNKLYDSEKPQRISLPTYPFAKERYWIDEVGDGRSFDMQCEPDGRIKSIEKVMNEIDDGTVETDHAVRVLKMLVNGNGIGAKLAYRK